MKTRARNRVKRTVGLIAIFALAFVLFLIFLRYFTTDKTRPEESSLASTHLGVFLS
jgi:heme/copper-type cytochrome/quinol oxidase subunit 4